MDLITKGPNGITPVKPLDPAEEVSTSEDITASNFAEARDLLDAVADEKSKFEKFQNLIAKTLRGELQKITDSKSKQESRLYEYQIKAVLNVADHFVNKPLSPIEVEEYEPGPQKALIVAPPGSGKSGMVTLIPYVLGSKKVLILTPSKIISEQLAADFGYPDSSTTFFRKAGMFLEKRHFSKLLEYVHIAYTAIDIQNMAVNNLVIANAQKFGGRSGNSLSLDDRKVHASEQLDKFDTIIVDEAHHYPAATWVNIVELFRGKKVIFLTATPFRGTLANERHMRLMGALKVVYEINSKTLEGTTIRPTEFIERPAVAENFEPDFLEQLKKDISEILGKHKEQEPRAKQPQAMVLVRTKSETKDIAAGLEGMGATFIISDKQSNKNLEDFTKGKKKIAVVCGMLREGYDNPNVTLVVILRKCKSRVLFEQFCGRCMRMNRNLTGKNPDKTVGTVLSYTHYEQSKMWAARYKFAEEDPEEEIDDDDVTEEPI